LGGGTGGENHAILVPFSFATADLLSIFCADYQEDEGGQSSGGGRIEGYLKKKLFQRVEGLNLQFRTLSQL